jgi:hypothetical protein
MEQLCFDVWLDTRIIIDRYFFFTKDYYERYKLQKFKMIYNRIW